jgi:hypothetical protein
MVIAALAVPIEIRSPAGTTLTVGFAVSDAVPNIAGFVPVGIVLAPWGALLALIASAALSVGAEAWQFLMAHRQPGVIDVLCNLTGAACGFLISRRWGYGRQNLAMGTARAIVAIAAAGLIFTDMCLSRGASLNTRGHTLPGALEAAWTFDDSEDAVNGQRRVKGIRGQGLAFSGRADSLDVGHPAALRLVGSMTITAWVNSAAFPVDDAVILSSLYALSEGRVGYQLDTTIDRGERTVGFKLTDRCGKFMGRYGRTPLERGRWYHFAGVYDARARTLDVYVDGRLDNGALGGTVSSTQRSARTDVFIGRRGDLDGFEFSGELDEVRLYSFPLTSSNVIEDMQGSLVRATATTPGDSGPVEGPPPLDCITSDREDRLLPGKAAAFGLLTAAAFVGFWPVSGVVFRLMISVAIGFSLIPVVSPTMPAFNSWSIPLVGLIAAVSGMTSSRSPSADTSGSPIPDRLRRRLGLLD